VLPAVPVVPPRAVVPAVPDVEPPVPVVPAVPDVEPPVPVVPAVPAVPVVPADPDDDPPDPPVPVIGSEVGDVHENNVAKQAPTRISLEFGMSTPRQIWRGRWLEKARTLLSQMTRPDARTCRVIL
jgi:hypothetical protein